VILRSLLAVLAACLLAPAATHAAVDPERNSTTLTGWHWWRFQSEAELNAHAKASKERIVDIEVDQTKPYRFTAALVRNKGVYKRGWSWWFGFSAKGVKAKVKDLDARIIDLERYATASGKRRFAFVTVRNKGAAAKGWWWDYDLTAEQVTDGINKHKIRLTDLDSYVVDGKRRYSYVGIKNKDEDKRAWWWYRNVSPSFVNGKLKAHKARLIDIERPKAGKLTVVMQKQSKPGAYWWWAYSITQAKMEELYQLHGVRIVDVERYTVNGSPRYAFIGLSDVNAETARLRTLMDRAYDDATNFGGKTIRGFYAKQVGGLVYSNLAGNLPFQPLSTLKLLPYTYAIEQIDKGDESLNTVVDWYEPKEDDPDTEVDERKYATCLGPGSDTTHKRAQFRHALPTMMWESHNRTLDAFLNRYTPEALTAEAQNVWGLAHTEMHYGCPTDGVDRPWAANRSTLAELGRLFEGVDTLKILKKQSSADLFYGNLINRTYGGASYTSPITGKTSGPAYNGGFKTLVEEEAGASKAGNVDEFIQSLASREKGGSGGPSSDEIGYSNYQDITVPYKIGGKTVLKTYVAGWFVYKLKSPPGCPDTAAKDGGTCEAIWKPEQEDLGKLKRELHRLPIRAAMKTWPNKP
jgi:hypothetical protein